MESKLHSMNYMMMMQLQVKLIKFQMITLLLHLNWPMVSFLVSALLQIMFKTEKGRCNLE